MDLRDKRRSAAANKSSSAVNPKGTKRKAAVAEQAQRKNMRLEQCITGMRVTDMERNLKCRPPIGTQNRSRGKQGADPTLYNLPEHINVLNLMINICIIRTSCQVVQRANWVKTTPHDVTVLKCTAAVAEGSEVMSFMKEVAEWSRKVFKFNSLHQNQNSPSTVLFVHRSTRQTGL